MGPTSGGERWGLGLHTAQEAGDGVRVQDEMRTKGVARIRAGLEQRE